MLLFLCCDCGDIYLRNHNKYPVYSLWYTSYAHEFIVIFFVQEWCDLIRSVVWQAPMRNSKQFLLNVPVPRYKNNKVRSVFIYTACNYSTAGVNLTEYCTLDICLSNARNQSFVLWSQQRSHIVCAARSKWPTRIYIFRHQIFQCPMSNIHNNSFNIFVN